jgi:hypothetical protein
MIMVSANTTCIKFASPTRIARASPSVNIFYYFADILGAQIHITMPEDIFLLPLRSDCKTNISDSCQYNRSIYNLHENGINYRN